MVARRLPVALGAVLFTAGCVGSVDRADFNADLRARGGGITAEQLQLAVEMTAEVVDVDDPDDLEILDLRGDATTRNLVIQARRGDSDDFVDVVVLRDSEIISVTPVQDADRLDLDGLGVLITDVPLADTEQLIDQAIETFGDPDTVLSTFQVSALTGTPEIVVAVESPRRTGDVVFDLEGTVRAEEDT